MCGLLLGIPKKPKDLNDLIQVVQSMLKTEKPSEDYDQESILT